MKHYIVKFLIIYFCLLASIDAQNVGEIDSSFGEDNGYTEISLTIQDVFYGVQTWYCELLPDNKLLCAGIATSGCSNTTDSQGVLYRLNSNGSLDTDFFGGYLLQTSLYSNSNNNLTKIGENQFILEYNSGKKIVNGNLDILVDETNSDLELAIGYIYKGTNYFYSVQRLGNGQFTIRRFNYNFEIEDSFGTNGAITISNYTRVSTIQDNIDDDVIIGGSWITGSDKYIKVQKYDGNGNVINSFGENGEFVFGEDATLEKMIWDNSGIQLYGNGEYNPNTTNSFLIIKIDDFGDEIENENNGIRLIDNYPITLIRKNIINFSESFYTGGRLNNDLNFFSKFSANELDINFANNGYFTFPRFDFDSAPPRFIFQGQDMLIILENNLIVDCAQSKWVSIFSRYFVSETLSVDDLKTDIMNIITNPIKSELTFNSNEDFGNNHLSIYDLNSKRIYEDKNFNIQKGYNYINLENINSGMYFLVIEKNNNKMMTIKFLKE